MNYLNQEAHPWVSVAVLAGGLAAAILLFWLVNIEAELRVTITNV
jgi:hypothetical protein